MEGNELIVIAQRNYRFVFGGSKIEPVLIELFNLITAITVGVMAAV